VVEGVTKALLVFGRVLEDDDGVKRVFKLDSIGVEFVVTTLYASGRLLGDDGAKPVVKLDSVVVEDIVKALFAF